MHRTSGISRSAVASSRADDGPEATTSLPTVTQPAGRCGAAAAADAISIAKIIIGRAEDERHAVQMSANGELSRNENIVPAGHAGANVVERLRHWKSGVTLSAAYSNVAPQDPQM